MRWPSIEPVGGWPAVIQEILIVVIGVLIALSAQQLVDGLQWRRKVSDFRSAIDAELGRNLESYRFRIEQRKCVRERLDQPGAWADAHETGKGGRLRNAISRPLGVRLQFSVCDQAGEAASHMPLKQRLAYAELYDEFRNYDWLRVRERELWFDIRNLQDARRLSDERQLDLRGMIVAAHSIDDSMAINWRAVRRKAAALGIRPLRDPEQPDWLRNLCDPLRWEER
jgi:hypothetical protein